MMGLETRVDKRAPVPVTALARGIRLALAAMLGFLAGACAAKFEPDSGTRFDRSSAEAVVVIGTAISRYPKSLGFTAYGASQLFEVGWAQIDPATRELIPGREWLWLSRVGGTFSFSDMREVEHFVRAIPPGTYILAAVSNQNEPPVVTQRVTSFIGLKEGVRPGRRTSRFFNDRQEGLPSEGSVAASRAPTFSVRAGEVVYLGDFVFDVVPDEAKLVRLGRDDRGAAEALAEYPNITGTTTFRGPDATTDTNT